MAGGYKLSLLLFKLQN